MKIVSTESRERLGREEREREREREGGEGGGRERERGGGGRQIDRQADRQRAIGV